MLVCSGGPHVATFHFHGESLAKEKKRDNEVVASFQQGHPPIGIVDLREELYGKLANGLAGSRMTTQLGQQEWHESASMKGDIPK